eukprot:gene27498-11651_t
MGVAPADAARIASEAVKLRERYAARDTARPSSGSDAGAPSPRPDTSHTQHSTEQRTG